MKKSTCFAVMLLLLSSASYAMERFEIVTTQELKQMLDDRSAGELDFILVNSLDEIIYKSSSIPGSVNVPWCRVDQVFERLGEDKNKLIVTY